jgi:protein gp37
VNKVLEENITQQRLKPIIADLKGIADPEEWMDAASIAKAVVKGSMGKRDVADMIRIVEKCEIKDQDLLEALDDALMKEKPAKISIVEEIVAEFESQQAERDAEERKKQIEERKQKESAKERTAELMNNCSLEEWKTLTSAEKSMLLEIDELGSSGFVKQKSQDIEWAQWSWNPVTGCKHDCPYCYARDIALSTKMRQVYPNGWEPTFRNKALSAPYNTKVPKEAEHDTRFKNVFTCSMADLFGRWVPKVWIETVFTTVRENPQWNFLMLTKFPQRLKEFDIPENAWIGTTVDLQARVANAEKAFAELECGVKWLSLEPLLEPIEFNDVSLFDWVVIGGSSASTQTPAWYPPYAWIERVVAQCREADVPVYFKSNLLHASTPRILELPFEAPIVGDDDKLPQVFKYLGKKK